MVQNCRSKETVKGREKEKETVSVKQEHKRTDLCLLFLFTLAQG